MRRTETRHQGSAVAVLRLDHHRDPRASATRTNVGERGVKNDIDEAATVGKSPTSESIGDGDQHQVGARNRIASGISDDKVPFVRADRDKSTSVFVKQEEAEVISGGR